MGTQCVQIRYFKWMHKGEYKVNINQELKVSNEK